jgi:acetyl-CoA decarbonylase/synthase complex subunit gamma
VGQTISPNIICIRNSSGNKDKFVACVNKVASAADLCLALESADAAAMAEAVKLVRNRRPLIICADAPSLSDFTKIAKENNVPIAVTSSTLEEAAQMTDAVKKAGVSEIVINLKEEKMSKKIQGFTYARRAALKKNFRPLGYPVIAFTHQSDPLLELAEAVSYVLKYAGIVIVKNTSREFVFPLLVARSDVYQDPQKPVQVEPKIYEIGKVTKDSPVMVTTNFSITYFTVAGEVEASKVPAYIICCDAEGMSVLTAWAAEKFTAERIAETLKTSGIEKIVSHKKVIIPGYVSVLSGRLEEVSDWKVLVGPREASGLSNYLRSLK